MIIKIFAFLLFFSVVCVPILMIAIIPWVGTDHLRNGRSRRKDDKQIVVYPVYRNKK